MEIEIESLRKRLEMLEEEKKKQEQKERLQKESIEYNLDVIRIAATKMVEEGNKYTKQYTHYKQVCKDYGEAFEAIYNSLRLLNEKLDKL